MQSLRCVYLHGLGTGPASDKAAVLSRALGPRGVAIVQPDLRRPSPRRMALEPMLEAALRSVDEGPVDLLVGASLGGWLALHVAAQRPHIPALLLLAPAVTVHDLDRERPWAARLWRGLGIVVRDKADARWRRVHGGLLDELVRRGAPPTPRVPITIVHGRRDRWTQVTASRRWVGARPDASLIEVDDGHELRAHHDRIVELAAALMRMQA